MKRLVPVCCLLLIAAIGLLAQEMIDAVKAHDLSKVRDLVEKDFSLVQLKDADGNTALHHAASAGSLPIVEYLLLKGSDINALNKSSQTPLHSALYNKNFAIAGFLIDKGCELEIFDNTERAPLHIAARANALPIIEMLIAKGVHVDIRKGRGMTPLMRLSLRNHDAVEAARLLVKHGADVNVRNPNNSTPLMDASLFPGSDEVISLLLDNNAEFDTTPQGAKDMLRASARRGLFRLYKYVIEKAGEEAVFDNERVNTTYMRNALSGGSIEIVKSLLAKNIPLSLEPDIRGRTPLHLVAENNKPGMLEFLIKNGADINQRTKSGKSAYNIAEENGHKEMMELIKKIGGNSEPQQFPVLTGPYLGQKPPANQAELFAPDIVIRNHSTIAVSPDGKELYWNSGPTFSDGPIMMTKIVDGKWIKPVEAPFSGKKYSKWDDCPFVAPDNKKLFFISSRPINGIDTGKENIWYVERTASGWSEPRPVSEEINAMPLHWQMSVSDNGNLYFASRSDEGKGIFCSSFVNGKYAKPKFTGLDGGCPYVSPDETYMIFMRLISDRYVPSIRYKPTEGAWGEPIDIQKYIGNGVCYIVSPDGKYVFVDGNWAPAKFIEALRPKK